MQECVSTQNKKISELTDKNTLLIADRDQFQRLVKRLSLKQPANGVAVSHKEATSITKRIGFPIVIRPSYVLGGRAMEIISTDRKSVV